MLPDVSGNMLGGDLMKILEYIILAFGIVALYGAGAFISKEVKLLSDLRVDLDMQLAYISTLTGERRKCDFEV